MAILNPCRNVDWRNRCVRAGRASWNRLCRQTVRLGALLLLGGILSARTAAQSMDEYKVKALFLYNFAKFVEWPDEVFRGPTDSITLCVLGVDPFGAALDDAVNFRFVGRRPLVVRRISEPRRVAGCQVLFVSSSERNRLEAIFDAVRNASVLTIGESSNFISAGGAIRFLLVEGNKVRFEINPQEAISQRLRISPNVLNLAKIVRK